MSRSRSSVRCSIRDMRASSGMAGTVAVLISGVGTAAGRPPGRRSGACFFAAARASAAGGCLLRRAPRAARSTAAIESAAASVARATRVGAASAAAVPRRRGADAPRRSSSARRRGAPRVPSTLRRAATRVGSSAVSRACFISFWKPRRQPPELAHGLADLAGGVGEALRAQHDQGDQQDDDELATPDVEHRPSLPVAPEGSGAAQAAGRGPGIRGRRAHLGDGHLHLAEASQLDLQIGGRLGHPTELHQRQDALRARRRPAGTAQSSDVMATRPPRRTSRPPGGGGGSRGGRRG